MHRRVQKIFKFTKKIKKKGFNMFSTKTSTVLNKKLKTLSYNTAGKFYFHFSKNLKKSIEMHKEALAINPDSSCALNSLVCLNFQFLWNNAIPVNKNWDLNLLQEDHVEVIGYMKRLLKLKPYDYCPRLLLNFVSLISLKEKKGDGLFAKKQYDEAIECCKVILDKVVEPNILFLLAKCYFAKNKNKTAIEAYEFAVSFKNKHPCALFNLGVCYMKEGMYDKAIEVYKKNLKDTEDDLDTLVALGECYCSINQPEIGLQYYRKASQLNFSINHANKKIQELENKI